MELTKERGFSLAPGGGTSIRPAFSVSKGAAVFLGGVGALVLFGWAVGKAPLIGLVPGVLVPSPVSATAIILCGASLCCLDGRAGSQRTVRTVCGFILAASVAGIGGLKFFDYALGLRFHFDQFLFAVRTVVPGGYPTGEMSPNTALCLLLSGLALVLFDFQTKRGLVPAQGLVLISGLIALLALIGYTYGVLDFYRAGAAPPMSITSAVCFEALCLGLLAARPERGFARVLTSATTGGSVARRLLPMAVLIPWLLGVLLLLGEERGYFRREFALAIFAASSLVVFTLLIWWNAKLLYRADLERVRAEEQLRQVTANLQSSNTELQQFAYVASHDLFEPLRMVTSYLELLEHKHGSQLDREAREFISMGLDGARRMAALIHDLLAYSRVEVRGRAFQPTDCEQALQAALANLKVAIEESGATITHGPLPRVWADSVQLTQVFQNLLGNAVKFHGPEPPRIDVEANRREKDWVFSVRDNGIGIDPAHFERIFVIFQRLHTRQEYAGTGMGLAICRKIIERHGGRIWVESMPGKGTTFLFTLPAMDDA